MTWLAVAVGGAIGSAARHGVNALVHHWMTGLFPTGIVVVNLTGCAVIGLLTGLVAAGRIGLSPQWREFVFVGLLGGFTIFSAFGLDTFLLVKTNAPAAAALNVALFKWEGALSRSGLGITLVWQGDNHPDAAREGPELSERLLDAT